MMNLSNFADALTSYEVTRLRSENESLNAQIQDRDDALLEKTVALLECQVERDELLTVLKRIGAWLEVRNLGGLMPQEKALITKVRDSL